MEKCYPTDLSDDEWECLRLHVPTPNKRGRPRTHDTREILNAVFYVLKSGCAWRPLPSAGVADSQSAKTTGVGGEQRGATTETRRCGAESATCWWTRRAWCSKPRYTAPRSRTRTGLGSCSSRRGAGSRA